MTRSKAPDLLPPPGGNSLTASPPSFKGTKRTGPEMHVLRREDRVPPPDPDAPRSASIC